MSSEFRRKYADFLVSCPDEIEVENESQSKENEGFSCENLTGHHLNQCNDDTSTIISDSIFESSSDHQDYDRQLTAKSSAMQLRNIGQSMRGSNENAAKISIENSSDVLFGSKTFFTGPVVIKQFINEHDAVNVNQKDEESIDTSSIIRKASAEKGFHFKCHALRKHPVFSIATAAVIIFFISAIVTGVYYLTLRGGNPEVLTEAPLDMTDYYEYVNRSEIPLPPPTGALDPLELPVKRVIIAHTATPICTDFGQCAARIINIQSYHVKTHEFFDIGLNFLVGGDGRAYEGRGYYVGAHTKLYNTGSICISFIGDYAEYEAPQRQLVAAQRFIADGVKDNKIDAEYVLYGQIQLNGNKSPGPHLYNVIKTWDHWSDRV